jgi:16S rRNA (guanine527-N7)-methyltransferase
MTPRAALDRGLHELALALPIGAAGQLMAYAELLAKWNRTYNLTAIRDPLDMVSRHLLDSLAVLPHLPMATGEDLADVGSGAGLPGIPLAIARRQWRFSLNDSNQKKTAFLRQATIELGLANAEVHEGRVEAWRPAKRFQVVISRAFAEVKEFVAKCRHLVAPGGYLAAMTGAVPDDVDANCRVIALKVPLLDAQRHVVLYPMGG